MQDIVKLFAKRFKNWRDEKGVPLKHVAAELDVSVSVVNEWENGHRFPSVHHLEAICEHTGVPACCYLYPKEEDCPRLESLDKCPLKES